MRCFAHVASKHTQRRSDRPSFTERVTINSWRHEWKTLVKIKAILKRLTQRTYHLVYMENLDFFFLIILIFLPLCLLSIFGICTAKTATLMFGQVSSQQKPQSFSSCLFPCFWKVKGNWIIWKIPPHAQWQHANVTQKDVNQHMVTCNSPNHLCTALPRCSKMSTVFWTQFVGWITGVKDFYKCRQKVELDRLLGLGELFSSR